MPLTPATARKPKGSAVWILRRLNPPGDLSRVDRNEPLEEILITGPQQRLDLGDYIINVGRKWKAITICSNS